MKRIGSKEDASLRPQIPTGPRPPHRELVLYVEDDDDNFQVADLRLSQGYALLRAANSAEACQIVRARGAEIGAILMDIELRGSELNGVELTKLIRGKSVEGTLPFYARDLPPLAHTPIFFVTAHGAKYSDAQLILAGGDKVIAKPVDFGALNVALTQMHLARSARLKGK